MQLVQPKWDENKLVCVGLDSDPAQLPLYYHGASRPYDDLSKVDPSRVGDWQFDFNRQIINATKDYVAAFKPNLAFYRGEVGKRVLRSTISYINSAAPDVAVILDAKQADIGASNVGYVTEDFDYYGADAVTVHGWHGEVAMRPFLDRADKGIIVVVRTSNPGADEFQNRWIVLDDDESDLYHCEKMRMYVYMAHRIAAWDTYGNVLAVVGATRPEYDMTKVRAAIGDRGILIPGIGKQGGDLKAAVTAGMNSRRQGMLINSSSGIIFASNGEDFAEVAATETKKLHTNINEIRKIA
jgi:orotidine-5'-phosphate decarboxylase